MTKTCRQSGFGAIVAIVVLVVLTSLAAGLIAVSTSEQLMSAQDILSARALAAARSGLQVGLYKALSSATPADPWKSCSAPGSSVVLDLTVTTGFSVAVTCDSTVYSEGESAPSVPAQVRTYVIRATACNSTTCPDAAKVGSSGYVERQLEVVATN